MRRPMVKRVHVQSRWQVDQVAREASWVQMCYVFWEGACAMWTCDGPWPLSTEPTSSDPPPSFHSSLLSSLSLLPVFLLTAGIAEGPPETAGVVRGKWKGGRCYRLENASCGVRARW